MTKETSKPTKKPEGKTEWQKAVEADLQTLAKKVLGPNDLQTSKGDL